MDSAEQPVFLESAAEEVLAQLDQVKHYFAYVATAPSVGAFSDLHSTVIVENEQVCSLNDVWNISKEMLSGFSGDEDVKRAVSRLSRLIAEGDGAALSEELADKDERGQMLAIVTHVLSPLTGMKASVSKREYAAGTVDEEVIPREHLGIGTTDTWHGSPDCRCDIDIINVDTVIRGRCVV